MIRLDLLFAPPLLDAMDASSYVECSRGDYMLIVVLGRYIATPLCPDRAGKDVSSWGRAIIPPLGLLLETPSPSSVVPVETRKWSHVAVDAVAVEK